MIPAAVFFLYAWLAIEPDLSMSVAVLIGVSGAIVIFLALGQYLVNQGMDSWSPGGILGLALVLRLLFVWSAPVLSDDIYRYLFDGLMVLHGTNPYAAAPDAAQLFTPEMADLLPLINHSHLVTLYPPAAQIIFAAGALLGTLTSPLAGMKLLLSAMDMVSCILLIVLVKELGLPLSRVILYAWNPLPVLEIAGSGHIDGAAVLFILAALALAIRPGKNTASAIFMALAVLTKWIPFMMLPFWLLLVPGKGRARVLVVFIAAASLLTALFWPEFTNGMTTLGQYLCHWEFSGSLFRELRNLTGSGKIARILLMLMFMGFAGAMFLKLMRQQSHPGTTFTCLAILSGAYLVLSPTVYPWYAFYLAVFLPFIKNPAGLIFSWSVMLSYRVLLVRNLTGLWIEDNLTPVIIVAAPAAALIARAMIIRIPLSRKRSKTG